MDSETQLRDFLEGKIDLTKERVKLIQGEAYKDYIYWAALSKAEFKPYAEYFESWVDLYGYVMKSLLITGEAEAISEIQTGGQIIDKVMFKFGGREVTLIVMEVLVNVSNEALYQYHEKE